MMQSGDRMIPVREDFAIETFGSEALIIRLADMRLFRVNKQAMILFEMLLESNCDASAALETAKEHMMDLDSSDIESVQKILFTSEKDQGKLQL